MQKCALDSEDSSFMNFKKVNDVIMIYCDAVKALQKFLIMIKNSENLSKLMNKYQIKQLTMLDKVFKSLIVAQFYNMTMNEIINKFETMMLSLQTVMKKIDSLMQNMTAFISSFNVYILQEFNVFSHSTMSMSTQFLHQTIE
jgi:methyl-accepting chemotaxis protein